MELQGYGRPVPSASDELEQWLESEGSKTLGGLVAMFEENSFALLFIMLMGVPALPLPTGGATHVFEVITMLLALELIAGRDRIWVPAAMEDAHARGRGRSSFVVLLTPRSAALNAFHATAGVPLRPPPVRCGLWATRVRWHDRRVPGAAVHRPRHAAGARRRPALGRMADARRRRRSAA